MTAGARPSASGDAHNASATASTLNHALGRKHIKSWMNGASDQPSSTPSIPPTPSSITPNPAHPVTFKKRGRPRKYPRPEEHDTVTSLVDTRTTTTSPAERLPPSNSTSPQLANIVTNNARNRSHGNLDVTVLPSPTPSEEGTHGSGLQIQGLGMGQTVNIDRFDFAPMQSPNGSSPGLAATIRSPVGQSHPLPKRPAGEGPAPMEKRARIGTARIPTVAPTLVSPLEPPTFLPRRPSAPTTQNGSTPFGQVPSRSPSLGQIPNRQMALPQLVQASQHFGGPTTLPGYPSPMQQHFQQNAPARQTHISPQLSAQQFGMPAASQQFAQHPPVVPSQRRSSHHSVLFQNSDWYTLDDCTFELKSLDAIHPPGHRNRKDTIRLQVLEEAVMAQDWAYLTLHQYYCILTFSPQDLPSTSQRYRNLHIAQLLMREVLDDNTQISPVVLAFFSTFPCSVEILASTWPARYQQAEREFANFVEYSANVGALRQASERRRVPPTPREFANCAITSVTFQRLLLRSIIRVVWSSVPQIFEKGRFEDQAVSVFNQAQAAFEQRRAAGKLGGRERADLELQGWTIDFTQITNSLKVSVQRHIWQQQQSQQHNQSQVQPQQRMPMPSSSANLAMPVAAVQRPQQLQRHDQSQAQVQQRTRTAPRPADVAMSRRTQPAPLPPTHRRPPPQVHTSSQPRQGGTRLLPPKGVIQPQQRVPVPSRFGLHQAHLRSPVLRAADLSSPIYFFWQGFVLKPTRLKNANTAIEKLSFTVGLKDSEVIAKSMPSAPGAPETRLIDEKHKLIRLRCVKWPGEPMPKDEEWAIADISWIPYASFTLNEKSSLGLRKKLHNGKDLPADLTSLITKGQNTLEVSVMSNSDDHNYRNYLIAVESLGAMTRKSIEKRCRDRTVTAQAVIDDIKRKLSPSATDDDDIVLMESTLTISLRDPFSASKICDTPVRGKACLHNECFDLDTFLETRPKKGDTTAADQWRCPICKADARPVSLVIDGFLVEVRTELERKGLLDTRAIIVSQDGSWKPKPEERDPNGVSDRDTPEPTPAAARGASRSKSKSAVVHEVIDLSD